MNTLIIAKMTKVTYDDWKIKFDEDAEVQSKMMRNTTVGKVDDNTEMVLTEVFNPEIVQEFMNSDDFKEMDEKEKTLMNMRVGVYLDKMKKQYAKGSNTRKADIKD